MKSLLAEMDKINIEYRFSKISFLPLDLDIGQGNYFWMNKFVQEPLEFWYVLNVYYAEETWHSKCENLRTRWLYVQCHFIVTCNLQSRSLHDGGSRNVMLAQIAIYLDGVYSSSIVCTWKELKRIMKCTFTKCFTAVQSVGLKNIVKIFRVTVVQEFKATLGRVKFTKCLRTPP